MTATDDGDTGAVGAGPVPAFRLLHLLDGFVTTQLLYVAARLGVADVLVDGPKSGAEVAAAVGAEPGPLTRVLRGLVIEDALAETGDGRFALTPVGHALLALRGAALVRGELYYRSAAGLLTFFDHLDRDAAHESVFAASMAGRAEQEADDVVAVHHFSDLGRIVDVGGGRGVLLARILQVEPSLTGVLVDRAPVISAARAYLDAAGVGDRAECVTGDFFRDVPAGAGGYLLSRVLHDWDDADAARILATCRRAMAPASRLLVVDAVLPDSARDAPAAIRMDVHMMLLLGARERTEAEHRRLLAASGFDVVQVVPTRSPAGLALIEAVPRAKE